MQVKEISRKKFAPASDSERARCKALMDKMRKEGDKLVKGIFEFVDAQGGWFEFSWRFFPGEALTTYKFTHGEICEVPLLLARHLNNCYKKVRKLPENADQGNYAVTRVSRLRFTPVDMLSEDIIKA